MSRSLAHRNRSDFCDLRLRCPLRTPEIARFPKQEAAMMHCDLRVRWKVASDLRFRAAISEPKTPSCCRISGDLAPSTRKSLAIAIVRFWCAKSRREFRGSVWKFYRDHESPRNSWPIAISGLWRIAMFSVWGEMKLTCWATLPRYWRALSIYVNVNV